MNAAGVIRASCLNLKSILAVGYFYFSTVRLKYARDKELKKLGRVPCSFMVFGMVDLKKNYFQ
jgi:hypothetical protein